MRNYLETIFKLVITYLSTLAYTNTNKQKFQELENANWAEWKNVRHKKFTFLWLSVHSN